METPSNNPSAQRIIRLCGVQGCCPTVEIGPQDVILRDDFGGVVKLTLSQWNDLRKIVAEENAATA